MVTGTTDSIGDLLFGKTRQAVLGLLFLRPEESFHLRQIVRLSGAGVGPVQRELGKLVAAGLILREERGRQVYFQAAQSPVFNDLRGLLVKTAGCADVLREALTPLAPKIRSAFIFGSFAKGNARSESDVDVMVVGDVKFADVARALIAPQRQLARQINPTVYPPAELERKRRARHHFILDVLSGPKVFLIGDERELAAVAKERVASPTPAKRARSRRAARGHRT
jgi:predicted nucleotidyltransferase